MFCSLPRIQQKGCVLQIGERLWNMFLKSLRDCEERPDSYAWTMLFFSRGMDELCLCVYAEHHAPKTVRIKLCRRQDDPLVNPSHSMHSLGNTSKESIASEVSLSLICALMTRHRWTKKMHTCLGDLRALNNTHRFRAEMRALRSRGKGVRRTR